MVGALTGYANAATLGLTSWHAALLGGILGGLLLALLMVAVKLVLLALLLGAIGGLFYVLVQVV